MTDKKASSSRGRNPVIQFSTPIGTPETKRKMLLYKRLLSRDLARDSRNTQVILQSRNRSLWEQDQGRFPKS
ncbi:uncharacterized protein LOC108110711 [Drosophila eugracilis]|uniref:uncharacterized protein LOC108110711 n=1 Tax=Drosophila eugracilis TaxID=29029 RepID=UPI001BD9CA3F|nr:uncharacterized protein LOC108110711 [Drosophila eugracilis]